MAIPVVASLVGSIYLPQSIKMKILEIDFSILV